MKIKEITDCGIVFDNGNSLTDCHERDCCETNYADWCYLKDEMGGEIFNIDFDENLVFEESDSGFRFGSGINMFFVPCYSEQNGYYSSDVDICYNGKPVLKTSGDIEYRW